jgi:hypothetical protein
MTDDGIRYVPVAGTWLEETLARALVEAGILGAYVFPAGMATKIIATPAGQSLAARVAALEAAVPVDPIVMVHDDGYLGMVMFVCYLCDNVQGQPHKPDCRWLAVRGGASVHRDRADV